MQLLERDKFLADLNILFKSAVNGTGQIAAVCGDAGIGKTSLVEYFTQLKEADANIYWGACDDLFTPRPLAPLYDIANKMNSRLIDKLEQGASRPSIFTSFLNELHDREPNIIVIEDIHWADESTFDLIKFLAKRINKYRSFLIITYRSDEIGFTHPLRLAFSNIPTKYFRRFELPPLSKDAVNNLTKSFGRTDESIFVKTGGNPFFITELLMNTQENIPATINDLIIFRLNRLSPDSRSAVETLSVIPGAAEKWLINFLLKDHSLIDEAVECGILRVENNIISFRHELVKTAVEESLSETKRFEKNSAVLNILLKQKNSKPFLARIIHHAARIGNKDVITKYAPLAAKQASKFGAHEQASKLYKTALQYADSLSIEEHLDLLEGRAYECYLTAQIDEGIQACEIIKEILRDHHDPLREGENYRRLSRLLWYSGKDDEGEEYLIKAIDILKEFPHGKQLAMSFSNLAQIYMLREETNTALKWGVKAAELARSLNDTEIESHALNNIGTAKMFAGDNTGEEYLKKSLELSLQNNFQEHACRAYVNLGTVNLYKRNLSEADNFFSAGVDYANEKDINLASLCIAGEVALTKLHMGNWDEAFDVSYNVYAISKAPVMDRLLPITIIGLIRARRNDPGAFQLLNEANELVYDTGELMKLVKVKASRAEAFWLISKLEENINELKECYVKIKTSNNPWAIGEIAFWLWKGGELSEIPEFIAEPFRLQITGDWLGAARFWEDSNCPYEHAVALSDGNEKAMKKAIEIFDSLGAAAASQLIKLKMRKSGIKSIPKGPRKSTKENPSGLTGRQMEILNLLAKGLSNSEIGNKLYISSRTVENHISTIFSKLNIHSRVEAAALVHSNQIKK
ncbi:MAG: helix-turn-helix transcriptional regulator [Ignavibacteriales bacterium]|nr:MAG: helix-turn-helix transcriptional regulator [Ignavibacteriales bacterium]